MRSSEPVQTSMSASGDSGYVPVLQTLRGVAIIAVVLFHYHGMVHAPRSPEEPFILRLIAAGNTGVTLFFLLSGFLLARPFLVALRDGRDKKILPFYRGRAWRILPAYCAIILVAFVVTRCTNLWKAFFFVPLGFEAFPFALPWWTLSTEMQFYAILPLLMLLPRSRRGAHLLAMLIGTWLGLYVWCAVELKWSGSLMYLRNSVFGRGTGFLAGALLAWFAVSSGFERFRRSPALVWLTLCVSTTSLLFLLNWHGSRPQHEALNRFPMYHDLEAFLWAGVVAPCLAGVDRHLPKLIRSGIDHIAEISYSLYLFHLPIQYYMVEPALHIEGDAARFWAVAVSIVASAIVSLGVAWLGWRFLEVPYLRRRSVKPQSQTPVRVSGPVVHGRPSLAEVGRVVPAMGE